jgi:hypothetical protein
VVREGKRRDDLLQWFVKAGVPSLGIRLRTSPQPPE